MIHMLFFLSSLFISLFYFFFFFYIRFLFYIFSARAPTLVRAGGRAAFGLGADRPPGPRGLLLRGETQVKSGEVGESLGDGTWRAEESGRLK